MPANACKCLQIPTNAYKCQRKRFGFHRKIFKISNRVKPMPSNCSTAECHYKAEKEDNMHAGAVRVRPAWEFQRCADVLFQMREAVCKCADVCFPKWDKRCANVLSQMRHSIPWLGHNIARLWPWRRFMGGQKFFKRGNHFLIWKRNWRRKKK